MDARLDALEHWLARQLDGVACRLAPASEDASFRRYFRAHLADGRTYIVMDAPPPQENCAPFVRIAQLLRDAGCTRPKCMRRISRKAFSCCPTSARRPTLLHCKRVTPIR
jgi:aminoglycoside/choline kinase family phosphotransferase